MSKTHGQLTLREIDLVRFGGLRFNALVAAKCGRRNEARSYGRKARELWTAITSQPRA